MSACGFLWIVAALLVLVFVIVLLAAMGDPPDDPNDSWRNGCA